MSEQNVDLVRKGFEHFLATGEPAWDTLHERVEARDHDIMDGREYRGHDDVRRWLFEAGRPPGPIGAQKDPTSSSTSTMST